MHFKNIRICLGLIIFPMTSIAFLSFYILLNIPHQEVEIQQCQPNFSKEVRQQIDRNTHKNSEIIWK